jgi:AcrR family transcriptional regulator
VAPVKPSTQTAIVAAAARLFAERGYQETSVADIAREAGVALQTVYNAVGAKRDVLFRVLEHAAAGEEAPTPVQVFMQERGAREPDPRRLIALMVDFFAGALERTAPARRMIRQAAALDAEVDRRERQGAVARRQHYGIAASQLQERGGLREGVTREQAAAVIFAVAHPDVYRSLVEDGGWSLAEWRAWATATLEGALLP